MNEEILKKQLIKLVEEINNSSPKAKIMFKQQKVSTGNMSVSGANGNHSGAPLISKK